jgi:hypothetical protein
MPIDHVEHFGAVEGGPVLASNFEVAACPDDWRGRSSWIRHSFPLFGIGRHKASQVGQMCFNEPRTRADA